MIGLPQWPYSLLRYEHVSRDRASPGSAVFELLTVLGTLSEKELDMQRIEPLWSLSGTKNVKHVHANYKTSMLLSCVEIEDL